MKITLKQFRCYEDSCFDFGKQGLTLLSGSSGAGKSTILIGIHFALFGTGTKLPMNGKTSCEVSLEIDGLVITRTKRPNRLVVESKDGEYEDDTAQSIINKKYGNTFKTTGYISQNARDSFILMSPIEKLAFLESFAFNDTNLTEIKIKCKNLIKERNDNLLQTTSKLEFASSMLKEVDNPERVDFPMKCSVKNREKIIKNEKIKNKNTLILIKRVKKQLSILQQELQSLKILNATLESKQESIDSLTEKLSDLTLEGDDILYEGDESLCIYKEQLETILSQKELLLLQERYDDDIVQLQNMIKQEEIERNKRIENIEDNIWKEYSLDECKDTIKDDKQIINELEKLIELEKGLLKYKVDEVKLDSLIQELQESKDSIENKKNLLNKLHMQQDIFNCPSCSVSLRFQEDELCIHDEDQLDSDVCDKEDIDTVTKDILKLKNKISLLESTIPIKRNKLARYKEISSSIIDIQNHYEEVPDINELREELEDITNYKTSQEDLEKKLTKLKTNTNCHSSTVTLFEKSIKNQEIKIKSLMEKTTVKFEKINEEELRSTIITQKQNKEKLEYISKNIKKVQNQYNIYNQQVKKCKEDHIEKYKHIDTTETELDHKIKTHIIELSKLDKQLSIHQNNLNLFEKYQDYEKTKQQYDSWINKINTLQNEELECRKKYASATLLREKILEAESISMMNIISSINNHSQSYLESFFPDNPISVKLVTFKISKSGSTKGTKKPQINLEIEYKGMEADISMLSGGELSRVILAYALALGEMFNTPLMLLDECTSSLDQDLTGIVMDGIRDNFKDKLVIIIAHQTVLGMFDNVIKI